MAKIKIRDIPRDTKISKEEMKKVFGGVEPTTFPKLPVFESGNLSQQITGVNLQVEDPIKYYPGNIWKSKS